MKVTRHTVLVGLVMATAVQGAQVSQASPTDGYGSSTYTTPPSPLLAIDQNRVTVVDRVVGEWGDALTGSRAGIDAEQLRLLLMAMRADQLLAASLAGSLDGLRNVVSAALVSDTPVSSALMQAKALGDGNQDLVYVPVTPCRLVETRGTFAAVYQGGGAFASQPDPDLHAARRQRRVPHPASRDCLASRGADAGVRHSYHRRLG